jgi:hypothetical protein
MLTRKIMNFPIVIPLVLIPTKDGSLFLGFFVGFTPPEWIEFLFNGPQMQKHGSPLFFHGAIDKGLGVVWDWFVFVPAFLVILKDGSSTLGRFGEILPPPVVVMFRHCF